MHLLASVIGKIERTGDLSIRYPDFTRDETGQTGHALNSLLESQQKLSNKFICLWELLLLVTLLRE